MKQQLSVWVSPDSAPLVALLKRLAKSEHRSMASLVFEAIDLMLTLRRTVPDAQAMAEQLGMSYEEFLHGALEDYMTRNQVV